MELVGTTDIISGTFLLDALEIQVLRSQIQYRIVLKLIFILKVELLLNKPTDPFERSCCLDPATFSRARSNVSFLLYCFWKAIVIYREMCVFICSLIPRLVLSNHYDNPEIFFAHKRVIPFQGIKC